MRPFALTVCLALLSLSHAADAAPVVLLSDASVPSGEVRTVWIVAVDDAGAPVEGLRLRGSADVGTLDAWRDAGDGLYALSYTAPTVVQDTPVQITVRGRGPDREPIELSRSLVVRPTMSEALSVSIDPTVLVLGDDASADLSLELPGGAQPSIGASFGRVEALTPADGGSWTARYVPRDVNFPHVAIVGVVDEREDRAVAAPVSLSGKVAFPVVAPAGATVVLRIAGDEFGPVVADANGAALVPIVVPPGVSIATQVVTHAGQVSETALDLGIPASRRVSLLPLPTSVPAGATVTVYAAVVEPTGEMDPVTLPSITASAGTVGPVRRVAPGLVAAEWSADGVEPGPVSLLVSVAGETDQVHAVDVGVLAGRPASIELAHDPIEGSGDVPVEVIVRDADDIAAPHSSFEQPRAERGHLTADLGPTQSARIAACQ